MWPGCVDFFRLARPGSWAPLLQCRQKELCVSLQGCYFTPALVAASAVICSRATSAEPLTPGFGSLNIFIRRGWACFASPPTTHKPTRATLRISALESLSALVKVGTAKSDPEWR